MVTKERLRSLQLDYVIAQEWNKTDTQGQFPLIQLEIRRTAASPALFEFLKQDHVPFWNHNNNPLPAILLTDTSAYLNERVVQYFSEMIYLYTVNVMNLR